MVKLRFGILCSVQHTITKTQHYRKNIYISSVIRVDSVPGFYQNPNTFFMLKQLLGISVKLYH